MNSYTFTTEQLKELLLDTCARFAASEGVFDFTPGFQIDSILAGIKPGSDLPLLDEPLWCACGHEERWHDNEDSHCDKCRCPLFQPVETDDWIEDMDNWVEVDEDWLIAALDSDCDRDDNITPEAIGLQPPF